MTPIVVEPEDWQVLRTFHNERVASIALSPDGAVFVATTGGIYRSTSETADDWVRLVDRPGFLKDLYAPSDNVLYAVSRTDQIYRWTTSEGWSDVTPPLSSPRNDPHPIGVPLNSVWGRGEDDVYVVGFLGTVLHFDGKGWKSEPNPLERFATMDVPAVYKSNLWAVGGDDRAVYAAGPRLIRKRGDTWIEIEAPRGFQAIAASNGRYFFGGDRDIYLSDDEWSRFRELTRFRHVIFRGEAQPDGSVLFWSWLGDLAEIVGENVHLYQFPGMSECRGAVARGGHLIVAGRVRDGGGVVARVLRR